MNTDPASPAPRPSVWSRKGGRVALSILLLLLVLWSVYLATKSEDGLPSKLGELTLTVERTGADAQAVIDRLHGKSVTPRKNAIGNYAGGTGEATLYVSVYAGPDEAAREEKKMADRIRQGNPVFGEYEELTIAGLPVSFCRGMGQVHYFFSSGEKVYWLAVDEPAAATSVADLVSRAQVSSYTW